ncbi:MAG: hypothetical protein QG665_426 [Patescibacteria group bacterium]|nr:hypothetical protein [Patescibacteria group bacterium]
MTRLIKTIIILGLFSIIPIIAIAQQNSSADQPAGSKSGYILLSPDFIGMGEGTMVGPKGNISFAYYLQSLYIAALSIAVFAAIITFVYAGFKYLWPKPGEKTEAKDMMTQALIGLILALTSYLILYTVNPKLLKFDSSIFGGLKSNSGNGSNTPTPPNQTSGNTTAPANNPPINPPASSNPIDIGAMGSF